MKFILAWTKHLIRSLEPIFTYLFLKQLLRVCQMDLHFAFRRKTSHAISPWTNKDEQRFDFSNLGSITYILIFKPTE